MPMDRANWKAYLIAGVFVWGDAYAQSNAFTYKIGNTAVTETDELITVQSMPPVRVSILPGGHTWPPLSLDPAGRIYAGPTVIEAASAKSSANVSAAAFTYPYGLIVTPSANGFLFEKGRRRCSMTAQALGLAAGRVPLDSLKFRNLNIVATESKVLALVATLGREKEDTRYRVGEVDLAKCRFTRVTQLGKPDLLVELGWSPQGGWWLTGSQEQTLLRSADGIRWKKFKLPSSVFSLTSAYVVNQNDIWLAAGLAGAKTDSYFIAHTSDGGKSWTSPRLGDPLLKQLPGAWLEGYRRAAQSQ